MRKRNHIPAKKRDKKNWTSEELSIIKSKHETHTDKELSKFIKKSNPSLIGAKRRSMGLYKYKDFHYRAWSREEVSLLKREWMNYNQRELQEKFFQTKTVTQIKNKKMDMGLKKGPKWSEEEINTLYEYGSRLSNKELSKTHLPLKSNTQISSMRKYYGIKLIKNES